MVGFCFEYAAIEVVNRRGNDSFVTETNPAPPSETSSSQPLAWLSWWYSAIFVVAVIGLIGTLIYAQSTSAETLQLTVIENGSGKPLAGAMVQVGGVTYQTNRDGRVELPADASHEPVHVTREGFDTWYTDAGMGSLGPKTVALSSNPSAQQASRSTPGSPASESSPTVTPASRSIVDASPVATMTASPPVQEFTFEGMLTNSSGEAIQGARIVAAGKVEVTGKDGIFSLSVDVATSKSIAALFIAPGFQEQTIDIERGSSPLRIALEPYKVKALYLNPNITETDQDVDRLIEMIDRTELNAVVIDIKEDLVLYDSEVAFFVDSGTVQPKTDLDALLKKFKDRGIYTIARLVVFKDSLVAEKHPDLAVLNNQTGDLWRDMNGVAWVNPMSHELWEANTDLALEAAQRGFDEIQFDYVRFPTDGDLSTMDFGLTNDQETRQRSIEKFLKMAQEKVQPTGAKLSADVFGYTMLVDDDLGIGQNFIDLAQYVDYLSPMIYPSHFPNGSIAVDGHPNDFPYKTIEISLRLGREKLGGDATKIRPWLQDFSFFDMMPYGDKEVRAQIDASNEIGTSGWMLWDPNNQYHPGALESDGSLPPATPVATPNPVGTPIATPEQRRGRLKLAGRQNR